MTFVLFLLVNVTLFLRPAELMPDLQGLPIYEVLMLSCCAGSHEQIRRQLTGASLRQQPMTMCVLGLVGAAMVSHLTHLYIYGAREAGEILLKVVMFYLVLVGQVTSAERLRKLLLVVTLSAVAMVSLCVIDYFGIVDFTFVNHVSDLDDDVTETGESIRVMRMCGTGIFEDPNDISQVIVLAGVCCAYFLGEGRHGIRRWGWVLPLCGGDPQMWSERRANIWRWRWMLPMCVLAVALVCTRSRGGLLAAGIAMVALLYFRHGNIAAVGAGLLGVCALPLMLSGRQANLDVGSGTGQERIQVWSEGLAELKSSNLIFGIGMNEYNELVGLVAHNSFVHAYVELGLVGGTLFFGCFFFAAIGLYRARRNADVADPELGRLQPYLAAVLVGASAGMLSLSRCYIVPTYLLFGLIAAYLNVVGQMLPEPRPLVVWERSLVVRLAGSSVALLAGLFVFVRLFARWGS